MKLTGLLAGACALAFTTGAAMAQVAAVGSTSTGGTSQVGRTLAVAVSEASPLQLRPQEMANTADYIPLVNAGELEFGIANAVQYTYAATGTGMSEGRPNENLRMVATLMPFRHGYVVRKDGDIKSFHDLKGKNVAVFSEGALGDYINKAYFANAGMTLDEVDGVPVPNYPRMWASFSEGTVDGAIVVVGSAITREFDATFGIEYLSFTDTPEAVAAMNEYLPGVYLTEIDADADIPGITEPTNVAVYDYTLFASTDTPDDMVYEAVKALWEKEGDLLATGPTWAGFEKEKMAHDNGQEYHPGAIRFYKEQGIWNR